MQRHELSELKAQLEKEKDAAYDLTVLNKELENKLSLIRDGVPVSTFYTLGMDIIHEAKLQKNLLSITRSVVFTEIRDHLIQDGVLKMGQVQTISKKDTDQEQMSELILRFLKGPGAYYHFRNSLKENYIFLVDALDKFVVTKEHIDELATTLSERVPEGAVSKLSVVFYLSIKDA